MCSCAVRPGAAKLRAERATARGGSRHRKREGVPPVQTQSTVSAARRCSPRVPRPQHVVRNDAR